MKQNITEAEAKVEWQRLQKEQSDGVANASISAAWTWKQVLEHGWFGYRSQGQQPIVAWSWCKKRSRWHYCAGYSR